jgi:hypothetical protein
MHRLFPFIKRIITKYSPYILFAISFVFLDFTSNAQISYPFQFYQFYENLSLFNPSAAGIIAPVELFAGNHSYISYLKAQYTSCNGNIRFNISRRNPGLFSTAGIRFSGYNEGKYIAGNRIHAVYSFHAVLSPKISFAGGLDGGFFHSRVEGTPSTGYISKYAFDGSAGIIFYNQRFHAGLSVNQLANNFIKPLQEIIVLYRHINFSTSYRFKIDRVVDLSPFTRICYPYFHDFRIDIGSRFLLLNKYNLMFSYRIREMASFGIGINNLNMRCGFLNAQITYNTPLHSTVIYMSTIEVSIGYFIRRNSDNNSYFFNL